MAYEIPGFTFSLKAGADLSAKQFYFVKLDSNGDAVVCAALTDIPIGVLQNAPIAGESATIMVNGISKVSADAALAIGDMIGPSADGQADPRVIGTDTTHYVCGQVLQTAGGADNIVAALINCFAPFRAA